MTKYRIVEKKTAFGINLYTTYSVQYKKLFFFWVEYDRCDSIEDAEYSIALQIKYKKAKSLQSSKVIKVYND